MVPGILLIRLGSLRAETFIGTATLHGCTAVMRELVSNQEACANYLQNTSM